MWVIAQWRIGKNEHKNKKNDPPQVLNLCCLILSVLFLGPRKLVTMDNGHKFLPLFSRNKLFSYLWIVPCHPSVRQFISSYHSHQMTEQMKKWVHRKHRKVYLLYRAHWTRCWTLSILSSSSNVYQKTSSFASQYHSLTILLFVFFLDLCVQTRSVFFVFCFKYWSSLSDITATKTSWFFLLYSTNVG